MSKAIYPHFVEEGHNNTTQYLLMKLNNINSLDHSLVPQEVQFLPFSHLPEPVKVQKNS